MILSEVIDQIRERDLVSILMEEGLPLKREGANYKCCCPFHDEKTPSFVVSPSRNIAHCFGESKSWDAIGFVMDLHHMTFYEAVEYLAKKLHIEYQQREETPEERLLRKERRKELLDAIAQLSQQDRLIFYRKYYYLQTTAQIASEIGMTERAIEGRLYRIKKRLRKLLGGDGNA